MKSVAHSNGYACVQHVQKKEIVSRTPLLSIRIRIDAGFFYSLDQNAIIFQRTTVSLSLLLCIQKM